MQELKNILLIVSTAIVISNSGAVQWLKRYLYIFTGYCQHRLKPLDCSLCLGFWLGLICHFYDYGPGWEGIAYGFTCGLASEVVNRVVRWMPVG